MPLLQLYRPDQCRSSLYAPQYFIFNFLAPAPAWKYRYLTLRTRGPSVRYDKGLFVPVPDIVRTLVKSLDAFKNIPPRLMRHRESRSTMDKQHASFACKIQPGRPQEELFRPGILRLETELESVCQQ